MKRRNNKQSPRGPSGLGERLREISDAALASGVPMLTAEQISTQVSEMRRRTELPPLQPAEGFGDPVTLLNTRVWLQKALEAKGAKITGGGCGDGQADLDIVLEGSNFNVSIRPI